MKQPQYAGSESFSKISMLNCLLSRQNHKENKNDKIPDIKININAIDTAAEIPNYMTIKETQQTTAIDDQLQQLAEHTIRS